MRATRGLLLLSALAAVGLPARAAAVSLALGAVRDDPCDPGTGPLSNDV